jgi:hypothetical protein
MPTRAKESLIVSSLLANIQETLEEATFATQRARRLALLIIECLHSPTCCDVSSLKTKVNVFEDPSLTFFEWVVSEIEKLNKEMKADGAEDNTFGMVKLGAKRMQGREVTRCKPWMCDKCTPAHGNAITQPLPDMPFRLLDLPPELRT